MVARSDSRHLLFMNWLCQKMTHMSQKQFEQSLLKPSFVDFLCNCPAEEGDLDLSRDPDDGSNREEAFAYD